MEYQNKGIIKQVGDLELEFKFHGCPECGDTLFAKDITVYNHGQKLRLMIGWCQDCLDIKGYILFDDK